MRVLVTGAFGFLGGRVVEALARAGHAVVVSGRSVPPTARVWTESFEVRLGDVLDAAATAAMVAEVDAVVHLASPDEVESARAPANALAVCGEGTRLLAQAARAAGARRFVFFSTFHVYGPDAPTLIDEETPTRPAHPYAIAHLAGEGFCRQARLEGLPTAVLRVSNGYGCPTRVDVDRWTLAHNDFCRQALGEGRIVLKTSGAQQRDFVWVDDVARAVDLVLHASPSTLGDGVFNVGGALSLSILEVAERVRARAEAGVGRAVRVERAEGPASAPAVRFLVEKLGRLGYAPQDRLDEETDRLLALLAASHA